MWRDASERSDCVGVKFGAMQRCEQQRGGALSPRGGYGSEAVFVDSLSLDYQQEEWSLGSCQSPNGTWWLALSG